MRIIYFVVLQVFIKIQISARCGQSKSLALVKILRSSLVKETGFFKELDISISFLLPSLYLIGRINYNTNQDCYINRLPIHHHYLIFDLFHFKLFLKWLVLKGIVI